MRKALFSMATMLATTILVSSVSSAAEPAPHAVKQKKLNVLFIGNSFTAGHNLAHVVKAMAEAGDPRQHASAKVGQRNVELAADALGRKAKELLDSLPEDRRSFNLKALAPGQWWMV